MALNAGSRVQAAVFLEDPTDIVLPGTPGVIKKVTQLGQYGHFDVQWEGIKGLWQCLESEVKPCP